MKKNNNKKIFYLLFFILGIIVGLNLYNQYDVNRDRKVTPADYIAIKKYIMNKEMINNGEYKNK